MIEKKCAIEIQSRALESITLLTEVLSLSENKCSPEEYQHIKRGVGLSIGTIQTELLDIICAAYPELDDLK